MVVEASDENQFSYFHILNSFLNLSRPQPTRPWRSLTAYISDIIKILYIFGSFFYHNFRLNETFKILIVSSERAGSDVSGSTLI